MAGLPWFELDTDFHDGPKVRALAVRLREPLADAYVSRLYAYCYRHARDRFEPDVAPETVEEACRWRGRRGVLFDALHQVGVLEREAGMVVVHGVKERLAPHLAKRQADAERQRRRRDKAARSIGRPDDVTPDVTPDVTRESRRDTDKDRDRDRDPIVLSQTADPVGAGRLAGEGGDLGSLRAGLAAALELQKPLGLGKKPEESIRCFGRWVAAIGEEATIAECVVLAKEKGVTPSHLSWFVGWLDAVPDHQLVREARQ